MGDDRKVSRRSALKKAGGSLAAGALAAGAAGCTPGTDGAGKTALHFENAEFYDADGKFVEANAKKAVIRLCEHHGYPVFPELEENLWVSDYGIGQFATLGLAAHVFVNHVEHRYMMLDIFLLPNQMLPEHWHVEAEGNPAKLEGWLVRWGTSHIVGIGEPNLGPDVKVPACHHGGKVTTEHEVVATPGMFVSLAEEGSRHWQLGGPEGGIVTEVANVHTNEGVRHTDPVLDEYFRRGA